MKFLVTKTFQEGSLYDALFLLQNKEVVPIDVLFVDHDLDQPMLDKRVWPFPPEIVMKIVKQAVIQLLKDYNFEMALRLIAVNKYMVHHFYYAMYCGGSQSATEKYHRLSRTIQIAASIYDNYMTAECVQDDQTIIMDYEGDWILSNTHPFYPWDLHGTVGVITVQHAVEPGLQLHLGPLYGDQAMLLGPKEKWGILHCKQLAFPYMFILIMDQFRFLSVFNDSRTRYYFTRFSMFLKALFGKYSKVYFYTKSIPLNILEISDTMEAVFEREYCFDELPNCVRQ